MPQHRTPPVHYFSHLNRVIVNVIVSPCLLEIVHTIAALAPPGSWTRPLLWIDVVPFGVPLAHASLHAMGAVHVAMIHVMIHAMMMMMMHVMVAVMNLVVAA